MGDSPQEKTKVIRVSPLTQYAIQMENGVPTVPFFEAHAAAIAANASDNEIILHENDFTIWQPSNPPQEVLGLHLTPP